MTQETIPTIKWLKSNAVIAAQKNLPERDYGPCAWILADHLVEKLIEQLTGRDDHFLTGCTSEHMYFTTAAGLVIIDPMGIHNKDVVTYNGFRYLRPEIDRERWYPSTSGYHKWMTGVTTDVLAGMELKRATKAAENEAKIREYRARVTRVEQEQRAILPDNKEYQSLIDRAMHFDHTFEYSDDHRYAMRTRQQSRELIAAINEHGVDGEAIFNRIIAAHGGN